MRNITAIEDFHFNCLQGMYFNNLKTFEQGIYLSSNEINDSYYNYCAKLKLGDISFTDLWEQINDFFSSLDREPSLYITPSSDLYCSNVDYLNLQKVYTDAWMILENKNKLIPASNNEQISISKVCSLSDFNVFVETFREAYSGDNPEDPYANLSPTYVNSLKNSYLLADKFSRNHYLARLRGIPVGVATAIEFNGITAIYNVGTITKYRNNGIGNSLMSKIATDFIKSRIIFLQTESGSYVEKWYESMGYKTMFLGECYTKA